MLDGHLAPGPRGAGGAAGVTLAERRIGLLEVSARRGRAADLAALLRLHGAGDLPPPGRARGGDTATALWIAPDSALVIGDGAALDRLRAAIGRELAAAVDQSHGFAVLRLAGEAAPRALAKLCRIDLHPGSFAAGQVARTVMAQVPVILHQVDGAPCYDLVVAATLARSFVHALIEAAAEFGCRVDPPPRS